MSRKSATVARLRRHQQGRCWFCAQPATSGTLCERHAVLNRQRSRDRRRQASQRLHS